VPNGAAESRSHDRGALKSRRLPGTGECRQVSVILIPQRDAEVNPLGIKGLGELGNGGANAAVARVVYPTRQGALQSVDGATIP